MTARVTPIPYREQVAELFAQIVDRPWSVWLDSGFPSTAAGRYDILAADPMCRLITEGALTRIEGSDGSAELSSDDPLQLLRQALGGTAPSLPELPFVGGAIGYFAYDLAPRLDGLPVRLDEQSLPQMAIGIYDWALLVDHLERRCWLVGQGRDPRTFALWDQLVQGFSAPSQLSVPDRPIRLSGELGCSLSRSDYGKAFARIQHYIHEGDCYQVNFAQRFRATVSGLAWPTYLHQRQANPAPYGAFLNYPFGQVLSSSPEQFLSLLGRRVRTRPIKGTRARGATSAQDQTVIEALRQSPKDRAENLMIVDLLRNDLGRVCRPGSIRVPALFSVKSFATVHHLVSTVEGELAPGEDALSLLAACFPGGSITGAPKRRAMEIIRELEPVNRHVYCGSIAWIGFDGQMDSNIAIRTLLLAGGEVSYWAGGGIVADSDVDAEYQESLDKAAAFFSLLGSARAVGSH